MTDPAAPSVESALALHDTKLVGLPDRFQPRNLTELMAWAKLMVSSGLTPKDMNEAGVILAVQMGAEVNVTPTQALQGICVINGRPSIWGDLGKALFFRDAPYEKFEDKDPNDAKKDGFGWCKITMKSGRIVERKYTREDAQTAKAYERAKGMGPWITAEGAMLQWRAIWRAMRDAAPGVFKGLAAREEQEDIPKDAEFRVHDEPRMPRATAEGIDTAAVEKFTKEVKPPPSGAGGSGGGHSGPSIDRSKLQKVIVKSAAEKQGGGKTFYAILLENSSGGEIETTTFDRNFYDTANKLRGSFALVATKLNGKYTNLVHIEAAPADEAPPPDEPGSNG